MQAPAPADLPAGVVAHVGTHLAAGDRAALDAARAELSGTRARLDAANAELRALAAELAACGGERALARERLQRAEERLGNQSLLAGALRTAARAGFWALDLGVLRSLTPLLDAYTGLNVTFVKEALRLQLHLIGYETRCDADVIERSWLLLAVVAVLAAVVFVLWRWRAAAVAAADAPLPRARATRGLRARG